MLELVIQAGSDEARAPKIEEASGCAEKMGDREVSCRYRKELSIEMSRLHGTIRGICMQLLEETLYW